MITIKLIYIFLAICLIIMLFKLTKALIKQKRGIAKKELNYWMDLSRKERIAIDESEKLKTLKRIKKTIGRTRNEYKRINKNNKS